MTQGQSVAGRAIGIDVGGTGIKGALVDVSSGALLTPRVKLPTPAGGSPAAVAGVVAEVVRQVRADVAGPGASPAVSASVAAQSPVSLPVGVALPGVVRDGRLLTAANLDREWIGLDAAALLRTTLGVPCALINDADAAGIAEAAYGAIREQPGTSLLLTFGTGIGSALIHNGMLVPNLELGHLQFEGHPDIERYAAAKVIEREGISQAEWASRAARLVAYLELLFHPDRFVLGGGISQVADEYLPFPGVEAPVIPARFRNSAGIVGAARLAADTQ